MATAEELLKSSVLQTNPEGHIVIGGDRFITVPSNLKRLGVQYDHNMETVTFDCPRYWDERDMSEMVVYINYALSDGYMDRYPADMVRADGDIMHFDWTISRNVTQVAGPVSFLVCVMKTDSEGNEERHWNSELCQDCYISPGMEITEGSPVDVYPDIITQLLLRMNTVEQINVTADKIEDAVYHVMDVRSEAEEIRGQVEEIKNEALDASGHIRNSYANAIKSNVAGEIIRVDDVSPIEHDVKCRVYGKNLFDVSKIVTSAPSASYAYVSEVGEDELIVTTEAGYDGNGYCTVPVKLREVCPRLQLGKTYILTAQTESNSTNIYLPGIQKSWVFGTAKVITEEMLNSTLTFYGLSAREGMGTGECRIYNIQIEEGSVATEYESYIDPTTVAVSSSGKNLWHSKNITYPRTVSGVTINYDEETQTYTFNGTSTSPGDIYVIPNQTDIMHINAGETWTLRVYPVGGTIDGASTCSGKMSPLVNTGDYTNTIHANTESLYNTKTYTEPADIKKMYFYVYASGTVFSNFKCRVQFELSDSPSEFEKSAGITTNSPSAGGTCTVTSKSPTMTLFTDTPGVTIEAEYNVDTVKFFNANIVTDRIQAAIHAWLDENEKIITDAITATISNKVLIVE